MGEGIAGSPWTTTGAQTALWHTAGTTPSASSVTTWRLSSLLPHQLSVTNLENDETGNGTSFQLIGTRLVHHSHTNKIIQKRKKKKPKQKKFPQNKTKTQTNIYAIWQQNKNWKYQWNFLNHHIFSNVYASCLIFSLCSLCIYPGVHQTISAAFKLMF